MQNGPVALLKRQVIVKNKILLATHHKAGTVWFMRMFRDLSDKLGLRFVKSGEPVPSVGWDIFHNDHSSFDFSRLQRFKGLHVIRDPRDQIVSATFYHQKSAEPWLHVPREKFGGLTYQQKLNSLASFDDKLLFEMEGGSSRAVSAMRAFDYSDNRFLTARFEDLIVDRRLVQFQRIFEFLGFRRMAIGWCLVAAYRNSLFSDTVKSAHVRSGKPKQWPQYFKPIHRQRFEELFDDVLEKLGYPEEWELID